MNVQPVMLPKSTDFPSNHHTTDHRAGRRGLRFLGHAAEMAVAMMLGMGVLFQLFGVSPQSGVESYVLLMALSMTVPMVAWMLARGHGWRLTAEMAAAMLLPPVALFPLLWSGLISSGLLIGLQHGLMLPAMLAAMLYRRGEYGL